MSDDVKADLEAAARAFRRAEKALVDRRRELAAAIVRASDDPAIQQTEIVRVTGYTRERIRLLVKEERERREQLAAGHDASS